MNLEPTATNVKTLLSLALDAFENPVLICPHSIPSGRVMQRFLCYIGCDVPVIVESYNSSLNMTRYTKYSSYVIRSAPNLIHKALLSMPKSPGLIIYSIPQSFSLPDPIVGPSFYEDLTMASRMGVLVSNTQYKLPAISPFRFWTPKDLLNVMTQEGIE